MNIILVGFMTSGKSTLGRVLAKHLRWKHIDLDKICEEKSTMKISEIFEKAGEQTFRQLETYYLKQTLQEEQRVISTGGGVVLDKSNRQLIKKSGFVIWLKTTPKRVIKYSKRNNNRPLLINQSLGDITQILEKRNSFYKGVSHYAIDTAQYNLAQIIIVVMEAYDEFYQNSKK